MTHRSEHIKLASDIARCTAACGCEGKTHCARFMAAVPAYGGFMTDHSIMGGAHGTNTLLCAYHIPLKSLKAAAAPAAERRMKAPEGLK